MTKDIYFYGVVAGISGLIQLAILVGGIIIAITRRQKHPRVSSTVLIGLALLIANLVIGMSWPLLIGTLVNQYGKADLYPALMLGQSVLSGLIHSTALVILLIAAFGWRQPVPSNVAPNQPATGEPLHSYSNFEQN